MPIKGLTCKEARSAGAIAKIGILRKGAPKSGNKPGKDLDHFRFDTKDSGLESLFHNLYGPKPGDSYENGIKFFFAKDSIDENMPSFMEEYRGGSCWRMCDGASITGERNGKGEWVSYPAHRRPDCKKTCDCSASGKLRIVIPEFMRFGIVEVIVGALNDLEHVSKQLQEIEDRIAEHGGKLSQVPLILYRQTRGISCPNGDGKRARRQKSMIEVAIAPEFFNRSLAAHKAYALAAAETLGRDRPQLAPVREALNTSNFSDEFGQRTDLSYTSTEAWAGVKMAFDKARSYEQADVARKGAIALVREGKLPERAIAQVKIAFKNACERIDVSGVQPLPERKKNEAVSVRDRIDAFAKLAGIDDQGLGAIAVQLGMPENLPEWSDAQVMKFRNNVYIACAKGYQSPEDARSPFGEFWAQVADKEDDAAVWAAWSDFW